MRERKAGARENEKTKVHRWEVEGKARWKKDREEVDGGRLRMERWWIEEGRGRVGSGVEGLPGWQYRGQGGEWSGIRREGDRDEGLRGWKTHPFSCLPSLAV